ncbi:MAG: PqqD family protein, partial [Verrucomicrobia bacterium]|nr:PqqD family protein [Verrucomicrobiota bacterium]
LHSLKEGRSDEDIAQQLVTHFEVSLEEARRDCTNFHSQLKNFGLA